MRRLRGVWLGAALSGLSLSQAAFALWLPGPLRAARQGQLALAALALAQQGEPDPAAQGLIDGAALRLGMQLEDGREVGVAGLPQVPGGTLRRVGGLTCVGVAPLRPPLLRATLCLADADGRRQLWGLHALALAVQGAAWLLAGAVGAALVRRSGGAPGSPRRSAAPGP